MRQNGKISTQQTTFRFYTISQTRCYAQLLQRDRITRYVSKFVLCFTSYESYKDFKQQVTFKVIQGHWQRCLRYAT